MSETPSHKQRRGRLLVVTYDYPPVTSAGMYRMVGMTKYLSRAGWDVTVLTVKKSFVHTSDASRRYIPENVRVIRTFSVELRRMRRAIVDKVTPPTDHDAEARSPQRRFRRILANGITRLFTAVERITTFPDAKAGWGPFLFFRLLNILRRERFDVVLSSSPPHSLHIPILSARLLRCFNWVVDFRDPWTAPPRGKEHELTFRIWRHVERLILSKADAIVANTTGNRAAIIQEISGSLADKTTTITNGFDTEQLLGGSRDADPDANCDIVYMGHLYPGMLEFYAQVIENLRRIVGAEIPRLCVFGGTRDRQALPPISRGDMGKFIEFKDRVPFDESLRIIATARVLLTVVPHRPGNETWVPSKLYPYLFSNRPILLLGPEGDAAEIVCRTNRGVALTSNDPRRVAHEMNGFLAGIRRVGWQQDPNHEELRRYSMESIAARMDKVLCRFSGH